MLCHALRCAGGGQFTELVPAGVLATPRWSSPFSPMQNARALLVHIASGVLAALCPTAYFLAPRPAWRSARAPLVVISRVGIAAALTLPYNLPTAQPGASWLAFVSAFLVYSSALPTCFTAATFQVPLRCAWRLLHWAAREALWARVLCSSVGCAVVAGHAATCRRPGHIPHPPSCLPLLCTAQAAPASGGAAAGDGLAAEPLRRTRGGHASTAQLPACPLPGAPLPRDSGVA